MQAVPEFSLVIQAVGQRTAFTITLPDGAHTPIRGLKAAIAQSHPAYPVDKQLIIIGGKKLPDDATLASAKISRGQTVHMGMEQ